MIELIYRHDDLFDILLESDSEDSKQRLTLTYKQAMDLQKKLQQICEPRECVRCKNTFVPNVGEKHESLCPACYDTEQKTTKHTERMHENSKYTESEWTALVLRSQRNAKAAEHVKYWTGQ